MSEPTLFHWTINGRPACNVMSRPNRGNRNCQALNRSELEAHVAEYKAEGHLGEAAVVEGSCPTHQMVLEADAEREAHWKRIEEERRAKSWSQLATYGGRFHLFQWIGKWVPMGPSAGRECQFERAEDALEWVARNEREEERDPERIRGLFWPEVLGKPIACGSSAFLITEIDFPVWPPSPGAQAE